MKHSGLLFTFLTLGARYVSAWEHISQTSLQEALESSAYVYVAFVMPTQDESQRLEKEWLATQKAEKDPNIVSFDCSEHLKFCKDLDVNSFPAIRVYHRDGRMDRFRGERKAKSMAMFLHRVLAPQPLEIEVNDENIESLSAIDGVVIVAHVRADDWDFWDRFKGLAKHYRDRYSFILSTAGGKKKSSMACYNNIDDQKHETSEVTTVDALESFVKLCSDPLIPELTRKNEAEFSGSRKSLIHFFASSEEAKEAFRNEIRPLARKYADYLHFTITDVNDYPAIPPILGLKPGSKTGLVLENTQTGDKFHYKEPLAKMPTAAQVESFLHDVIDGKIKAWNGPEAKGREHEEL
ncbi:thioredoxin-like fold protein [Naviculisporaceae sp. PSN 640]